MDDAINASFEGWNETDSKRRSVLLERCASPRQHWGSRNNLLADRHVDV